MISISVRQMISLRSDRLRDHVNCRESVFYSMTGLTLSISHTCQLLWSVKDQVNWGESVPLSPRIRVVPPFIKATPGRRQIGISGQSVSAFHVVSRRLDRARQCVKWRETGGRMGWNQGGKRTKSRRARANEQWKWEEGGGEGEME